MASWTEHKTDPPAEQGFPRTRKRPGTEFSQGGWHYRSGTIAPPDPPSRALVLLPFIILLIVGLTLTVGLLYAEGRI